MFPTLFTVALFGSFAVNSALAAFEFHTPQTVNACEPVQFGWTDGQGPNFDIIAVANDKPCDSVLAQIPHESGVWHTTWTPPQELAGQQILISVLDGADEEAWSETITVGDGCNKASSASASQLGSSASSPAATGTGAAAAAAGSSGPVKGVESSAPNSAGTGDDGVNLTPVGAAGAGLVGGSKSGATSLRVPAFVLGAVGSAFLLLL